jgi:hypothetical protein
MTMKDKLLVLSIFVIVVFAFVVTHVAGHLLLMLQNCFALALPVLRT